MSEDNTIPKQELLAKLLRMTTSSNDGEALTAMRKANALLTSAGWDWDKLLAGKIKIVENPFAGLGNPLEGGRPPRPTPAAAPVQPVYRPAVNPQATPQPTFTPKPLPVRSQWTNKFPNHCWGCAKEVPAHMGWIFKPREYNQHAVVNPRSMWEVLCTSCNHNMTTVHAGRAFVTRKRGKATIGDLA